MSIDRRSLLPAPLRTEIDRQGDLWLKDESVQPTGSVKYRWVYRLLVDAIEAGLMNDDTTLKVASQGYVATALAFAGKCLALPVEIHCTPEIAPAIAESLVLDGAEIVYHPNSTGLFGLLMQMRQQHAAGTIWHADMYDRQTLLWGYRDLAREVLEQIDAMASDRPSHFVCPVGTGGLVQALGEALRDAGTGLRIVAVEAAPGQHIGGTVRNTETMNLGPFDPYQRTFPDETWFISEDGPRRAIDGVHTVDSACLLYAIATQHGVRDALLISPE